MDTKLSFCCWTGRPICESGILWVRVRATITGTGTALLTLGLAAGGAAGAFAGRSFASGFTGAEGSRRALTAGTSGAVPCCRAASRVPAAPAFGPRRGWVAEVSGEAVSTNFTDCAGTTSLTTGGSTARVTVASVACRSSSGRATSPPTSAGGDSTSTDCSGALLPSHCGGFS